MDACVLALNSIVNANNGCPDTYERALASLNCALAGGDHAMVGPCGLFIRLSYGHDGLTTCTYDSTSHVLVGGTLCGIPPFYIPSCSRCRSAGQDLSLPTCLSSAAVAVCSGDAGQD